MSGTRHLTAAAALLAVAALVTWDLAASGVPNPYRAPPMLALGSGAAASGAHCAALPSE